MKKCLVLFFLFFLIFVPKVLAVDLTVTCNGTSCDTSPGGNTALFEVDKWLPGESMTQKITADNTDNSDDCNLYAALKNKKQTPADFASKVFTAITQGIENIFGARSGSSATSNKLLQDIYDTDTLFLKTIPAGQTVDFDWTVTFDPVTGNYYQAAKTSFDFDLNFSCGIEPAPTSTPLPTNTPVPASNPASVPAPGCSDPKPEVPTGFYAVSGPETGEITLYWTAPSRPYTYFYVGYSDASDWPPKWGNPDVGDTNNYTVSGLGSGTYWFWVRAGNGCMPGDFVGPVSAAIPAGVVGGLATGFSPAVLGVVATPTPTGEVQGERVEQGEVHGEEGCGYCIWWQILLGGLIVLLFYYLLIIKRYQKMQQAVFAFLDPIFCYIVFLILNRGCVVPSLGCKYFLFLDALLYFTVTFLFKKITGKEKS